METKLINFEETELRLGLPGGGGGGGAVVAKEEAVVVVLKSNNNITNGNGKREFVEAAVDLKLNLSSKAAVDSASSSTTTTTSSDHNNTTKHHQTSPPTAADPATKPPAAKAQVVGWPPVRSYRKNILAVQKSSNGEEVSGNAALVKVSMDGAPYLRKVDLKMYKAYKELYDALAKLFITSFPTNGNCGTQGQMKDFMNENKGMDLLNGSDYVPTYEDKDGDWMLVGDVPWEMFVGTCKRLRIMKGTDAKGLAPRAMEKCKNRS